MARDRSSNDADVYSTATLAFDEAGLSQYLKKRRIFSSSLY
jgi:hypothetical protein